MYLGRESPLRSTTHRTSRPSRSSYRPAAPALLTSRSGPTGIGSRPGGSTTARSCSSEAIAIGGTGLTCTVGQLRRGTIGRLRGSRGRCRSGSGTKRDRSSPPVFTRAHADKAPGTWRSRASPSARTRSGSSLARRPSVEPIAEAMCTITGVGGSTTRYGGGPNPDGQ